MITRVLEAEEWPVKLEGTELETVWPLLPHTARVLVVEDNGHVLGSWAIIPSFHVECVSIREDHQARGVVAKRLLEGMGALAFTMGAKNVFTASDSEHVTRLLEHLDATKLPGDHYVIPVENMRCQRQ